MSNQDIDLTLRVSAGLDEFLKTADKFAVNEIKREYRLISNEMKSDMKKNIRDNKSINTGLLRNSIFTRNETKGTEIKHAIGSNIEYAEYIEFGTKAHFPPVAALLRWVHLKVKPKLSKEMMKRTRKIKQKTIRKLERIYKIEQLERGIAFCIARAISKRGTKAQPFIMPAYEKYRSRVDERVMNAIGRVMQG